MLIRYEQPGWPTVPARIVSSNIWNWGWFYRPSAPLLEFHLLIAASRWCAISRSLGRRIAGVFRARWLRVTWINPLFCALDITDPSHGVHVRGSPRASLVRRSHFPVVRATFSRQPRCALLPSSRCNSAALLSSQESWGVVPNTRSEQDHDRGDELRTWLAQHSLPPLRRTEDCRKQQLRFSGLLLSTCSLGQPFVTSFRLFVVAR